MHKLIHRSFVVAALAALPCVALVAPVQAAYEGYLTLKGKKSGDIKGSVTAKNFAGALGVRRISHQILSPRDAATGMASGKRQHKALEVVVDLDQAMPLLMGALTRNEQFSEVVFSSTATDQKTGNEFTQYQVKLINASLSAVKLDEGPEESGAAAGAKHNAKYDTQGTLVLSFTYQKIIWTFGKSTAEDDWGAVKG